jgi:hypothetical protein
MRFVDKRPSRMQWQCFFEVKWGHATIFNEIPKISLYLLIWDLFGILRQLQL